MKKIITILHIAVLLLIIVSGSAAASERALTVIGSPVTSGEVTVTLEEATAVKKTKPVRYEDTFRGRIENNSDEGIMRVIYTFALADAKGDEFRSFAEVYDGEDKAIPPHTAISFSHDGIKWGAQSVPASVTVRISSVKTESELPPANVPHTGDRLYQALGDEKLERIRETPPAELLFHIDQGGYGRTATFQKGSQLDRAVELLCDVTIGEAPGAMVTDNYNWIHLKWEDGSETHISLNLYSLEYDVHGIPHSYSLENLDAFWSYCSEYLTEDN